MLHLWHVWVHMDLLPISYHPWLKRAVVVPVPLQLMYYCCLVKSCIPIFHVDYFTPFENVKLLFTKIGNHWNNKNRLKLLNNISLQWHVWSWYVPCLLRSYLTEDTKVCSDLCFDWVACVVLTEKKNRITLCRLGRYVCACFLWNNENSEFKMGFTSIYGPYELNGKFWNLFTKHIKLKFQKSKVFHYPSSFTDHEATISVVPRQMLIMRLNGIYCM